MMMRTCQGSQTGTSSASPLRVPQGNSGRSYSCALQFQADSGCVQITSHSNTQSFKRPDYLASSLKFKKKKKYRPVSGQMFTLDADRQPSPFPSSMSLPAFIKDAIPVFCLSNSVNQNFLVFS